MNKNLLAKIVQSSDLTTAVIDLKGEEYSLFIQKCSDGLYCVDFGGRLGDLEAVSDLLSRLNIKQFFI